MRHLKETNFDLEANRESVEMMRREAQGVGKRFTGKIQNVKKLEKRLSLMVKANHFGEDEN